MYVFGLGVASAAPLQQFCDDQFNAPMQQPGRVKVLAPFIALTFTRIAAVTSSVAAYATKGTLTEHEVAIWLPVVDSRARLDDPAMLMALPYMLVDNVLALAAGREIFGFPKDPAVITIPDDPGLDGFAVDAEAVRTFGAGAHIQPVRIIEVSPAIPNAQEGAAPKDGASAWTEMVAVIKGLVENLGNPWLDLHLAVQTMADVGRPEIHALLLKQMRDIEDASQACYQGVVRAPLRVTAFTAAHALGAHVVHFKSTDTHPLVQSLGLGALSETEVSLPALFAYQLQFDSVLPDGEVLWDSTKELTS